MKVYKGFELMLINAQLQYTSYLNYMRDLTI